MTINNKTPEEIVLEFLRKIITGTEWNNKIFAVGGCVRDELMGLRPKDLDFVVNGDLNSGIEFSVWLAKIFGNYKENSNPVTYPRFGTSKLSLFKNKYNLPNIELEFVSPRKEKYTFGDRKPEVTGGDLTDEVNRRDITINTLMKNVSTNKIIDLTGKGISDIKNGIIRTPINPEITFKDDGLRLMRVVRFSTRYGFKIDNDVLNAMKKNSGLITTISKERINDELNKILVSPKPDEGFRLLQSTGLLKHIIPELDKTVGMSQGEYHTEDVFNHILSVVSNTPPDLKTRLMAVFHDIGKVSTQTTDEDGSIHFYDHENVGAEITKRIMKDLKYSNDMIEDVAQGVGNHMRLKSGGPDSNNITDKTLRRFSRTIGGNMNNILDLIHADNISHKEESSMPDQVSNIKNRLDTINKDIGTDKPKLPIDGNDILALGVPKSRSIGDILDLVQDAWDENPNITREDAINIVNQFKIDNNINEIKNIMKKLID